MRKLRIPSTFYDVLIEKAFDHFTILELRDACFAQAIQSTGMDRLLAYKKTYRQVERLVHWGLLTKTTSGRASARYVKTEAFYAAQLEIRRDKSAKPTDIAGVLGGASNSLAPQGMAKQLQETIRQYQVDLLACIGESEEYMRLYSDFPELKAQLEPQYFRAREQSSKLLGKIRALDAVLSQLPQMTFQ